MKTVNIGQLVDKFNAGECSAEEEQILKGWLHQYNMESDTGLSDEYLFAAQKSMLEAIEVVRSPKVKKLRLGSRIAAAAAIILVAGASIVFYIYKNSQRSFAVDIAPGHIGATLTLSDGQKIRLADVVNGELAKEAGVVITKTADGKLVYEVKASSMESNKINTITTANGETYELRLPDGTLVWLNAASSLTYAANLKVGRNGKRRVRLTGEGYFEVAKDKAHPFLVETDRQVVEVLGTHFNVYAYNDEPLIKTTLLEGSVSLNQRMLLEPGEQGTLGSDGRISVARVDVDEAVAWKNGKFVFDDEPMESIMRKLSRWYDVEVVFQDDVRDKRFNVTISRFDHISKILDMIAFTQGVHFKIEGRRITVMR